MSRATTEDQLQFLICCVKHSNNGKVDFVAVAHEFDIISKGAAAKRYERLLKTYTKTPSNTTTDRPSAKSLPREKSKAAIAKAAAAKRKKIEGDSQEFDDYDDDQTATVPKQEPAAIQHLIKLEPPQSFSSYPYPPMAASSSFMPVFVSPGKSQRTNQQNTHGSLASRQNQPSFSTRTPARVQSSSNMAPPFQPHHQPGQQQPRKAQESTHVQQDLHLQSPYQITQPLGMHQGLVPQSPYQTQQQSHMSQAPLPRTFVSVYGNPNVQMPVYVVPGETSYGHPTITNEMMQTQGECQGSANTLIDGLWTPHGSGAPQVAVEDITSQPGMIKRSNSIDLEAVTQSIPLPPQEVVFEEPEASVPEPDREEGRDGANYIFIED